MPVRTVQLSDFSDQFEQFAMATLEQQKDGVYRGCLRSIPGLVEDSPVDNGLYANSWDVFNGDNFVIVGNTAPHAAIVENGARPYDPPIGPLLAWAKRKLQDPSQPPKYSAEVRKLAWAVKKKIQREGQAPKKVMERNLPRILENIASEIEEILNG